ncbi:MAG TPA: isoprenylcysteine carboxylmethyltransferase family protein, partial [Povalibacter sp.]
GKNTAARADRGSLLMIWTVVLSVLLAAAILQRYVPQAQWPMTPALYLSALTVFCVGLALRWYSIFYLGKYFTVDIAIATDHRVIDTGPYRYVRHPSYTGVLLEFLGLSLCMGNVASLLLVMIVVAAVFLYRMRIEEAALQAALGTAYTQYMERTRRLIPFVY